MNTTAWKFSLDNTTNHITMPTGAQLLHVDVQGGLSGGVRLWALVDPDAANETRTFHVIGTGDSVPPEPTVHVGSALTPNGGRYVVHVFEEVPRG